jgi:CRP/FNR family transcriptional regulator, cyclic AMP receptor protein
MRSPYGFHAVENCTMCPLRPHRQFCQLPEPVITALNAIKQTCVYPQGALLFMEGQDSKGVFILCTGKAKVSAGSAEGKIVILRIAEAGEILGLSGVVSGRPYQDTVQALELMQVNFIPKADFLRFLATNHEIGLKVAQQLSHNCSCAVEEIRSLALSRTVPERLATLLLQWADSRKARRQEDGSIQIMVGSRQEDIAHMIGTTRETVSRIIAELKRAEMVNIQGSFWTIQDRTKLERYRHTLGHSRQ